jgi:malonate transporter
MTMLNTILGALLPMIVTFLLGYVAAWRHDFGSKDAPTLNRMVLLYAVPLALFAGTFTASRAELSQDIPLVIALCVAIIGPRKPLEISTILEPDARARFTGQI